MPGGASSPPPQPVARRRIPSRRRRRARRPPRRPAPTIASSNAEPTTNWIPSRTSPLPSPSARPVPRLGQAPLRRLAEVDLDPVDRRPPGPPAESRWRSSRCWRRPARRSSRGWCRPASGRCRRRRTSCRRRGRRSASRRPGRPSGGRRGCRRRGGRRRPRRRACRPVPSPWSDVVARSARGRCLARPPRRRDRCRRRRRTLCERPEPIRTSSPGPPLTTLAPLTAPVSPSQLPVAASAGAIAATSAAASTPRRDSRQHGSLSSASPEDGPCRTNTRNGPMSRSSVRYVHADEPGPPHRRDRADADPARRGRRPAAARRTSRTSPRCRRRRRRPRRRRPSRPPPPAPPTTTDAPAP